MSEFVAVVFCAVIVSLCFLGVDSLYEYGLPHSQWECSAAERVSADPSEYECIAYRRKGKSVDEEKSGRVG